MFAHSQQYLECEHAQLIFGEGGARAVSYPVWKLCALLSLPRFGGLQGRLVANVGLLASLWLPRDASALIDFFQDSVELLENAGGRFPSSRRGARTSPPGHRTALGRPPLPLPGVHDNHRREVRRPTVSGTQSYAQLWSLLGRQLDTALRPDTEALHQVSLEALVALLEEEPPVGVMPQLGITCLRLAGRALLPREGKGKQDENPNSRVSTSSRIPAIQGLTAKCIRLIFPGSCSSPQVKAATTPAAVSASPTRQLSAVDASAATSGSLSSAIPNTSNVTPPIATASWASLSAALPCIVRWWAGYQHATGGDGGGSRSTHASPDPGPGGGGDGAEWNTEAVSLARAVAAAYASAVEGSQQFSPAGKSLATAEAGAGREKKNTSRGRRARGQAAAAVHVPKRFAPGVSALISVPCVQPELVRALRAVLGRFPRIPTAVLRRAELADRDPRQSGLSVSAAGQRQEQHREMDDSTQGGEMAPPPPRQPSGKKRRVSLEPVGLRAAAAGGDSCGDLGEALVAPRGCQHEGELREGGGAASVRGLAGAPLVGQERPTVFSGDSAALEAIDAVLARAGAALDFFEAREAAWVGTDSGGDRSGGETTTSTGDQSAREGEGKYYGSSNGHLHLVLQHTASVTCALRMLAPFVDRARLAPHPGDDEAGRRLEFGGSCYKRGPATRMPRTGGLSTHIKEINEAEVWPSLIGRLVGGFTAAVRAIARYKADGRDGSHASVDGAADRPPSAARAPRAVALLLDMAVNCAAEIPTALLDHPAREKRGNDGEGSGDRGEPQASLLAAIGLVAEKALGVVISPGSAVLDAARLSGTVLGPAIASAPFPLKCFLLAAAFERERTREEGVHQDAAGVGRELSHRKPGGNRGGEEEESRPKKRRALGGSGGIGEVCGIDEVSSGGLGGATSLDDDPVLSVEEAFLTGLQHDGSALVVQCAVAALPMLSLCSTNGKCCSDSSSGGQTAHVEACDWRSRWLPALLSLSEPGGSEAVRLELAAALPRLGSSLDSARSATTTTENDQIALPKEQRLRHPEIPESDRKDETPQEEGPNAFTDLLSLWPKLLKDESAAVRGAAARAALSAAAAAPLSRLKSAGAEGALVLRLLTEMLACGDPEVSWVVAGGAGQFVADEGKFLRAMYGSGGGGEEDGDEQEEEEDEEDTLGEEEEKEQEGHFREVALSKFIKTVGKMLQEHGDRLRHGRWQSLHDFTALLRALGSIGCESDPTDELGRSVYLWTLIRLVDVWVDEGNECGSAAHEQIVRVCNRGRVPLAQLLTLPPASTSTVGVAGRGVGTDTGMIIPLGTRVPLKAAAGAGRELDSGSVLAPLMEKLMETGHLEEFVEQALKSRNLRAFLEGSVAHVLPVFVAGSKAVAVEQLAALCDHFEVGDARGTDPPQRLLNRHLPHVLTDVLMRGRSAWTDERSSPGLQFLLKYFPDSTPKRLIEGVLPQILEQVSWQLCGPRREEATVALQAVAHISYRQAVSDARYG
ncbi:unnamed protein product [Laminaria digitata]